MFRVDALRMNKNLPPPTSAWHARHSDEAFAALQSSAVGGLAEVEHAELLKEFLDEGLVDELHLLVRRGLQCLERREQPRQVGHRGLLALRQLAVAELRVVGEQHPITADLVFQRQGLDLELDPVVAGEAGPYVERSRRLHVRVAELEHDLRVADREVVRVAHAAAQDEGVVVEPEVLGVEKGHLAHAWPRPGGARPVQRDTVPGGHLSDQSGVVLKSLGYRKPIRLQDQLTLQIVNLVEKSAVTVLPIPDLDGRVF